MIISSTCSISLSVFLLQFVFEFPLCTFCLLSFIYLFSLYLGILFLLVFSLPSSLCPLPIFLSPLPFTVFSLPLLVFLPLLSVFIFPLSVVPLPHSMFLFSFPLGLLTSSRYLTSSFTVPISRFTDSLEHFPYFSSCFLTWVLLLMSLYTTFVFQFGWEKIDHRRHHLKSM